MKTVTISGGFDNIHSSNVRFLHEASKIGHVNLQLWTDEIINRFTPETPVKFPLPERLYFLESLRYVTKIQIINELIGPDELDLSPGTPEIWVLDESQASAEKLAFCAQKSIKPHIISKEDLIGFPSYDSPFPVEPRPDRKKIIVTGCYDWLHSGHIRFFEEVSELGDLYVAVGHDANIRLLKGEGHPLFPAVERQYMVQSIRYVTKALITSGLGWMDAAPEIEKIKPQAYAVNEDGDKPEKRAFCLEHGLEYLVLKRTPKSGLPKRQSTDLRGF